MNSNNMPSQRQIRFGELIRKIISESIVRGDFFIQDFDSSEITVSFVKMSKDLKIANIYFIPLGGEFKETLLDVLNSKKYIFQKYIAKAKLQSKFTPKIKFYIDDSFEEAEKISKLLMNKKVSRDL